MNYYISDLHFFCNSQVDNGIGENYDSRPFKSLDEMHNYMLSRWNEKITNGDTVYILGDICHHMRMEQADEFIKKLNGKKYLIKGNHDKNYDPRLFADIQDFMTASVNGQYFALMHYPMLSWPKKNSGSIQLHGHIHARMDYSGL